MEHRQTAETEPLLPIRAQKHNTYPSSQGKGSDIEDLESREPKNQQLIKQNCVLINVTEKRRSSIYKKHTDKTYFDSQPSSSKFVPSLQEPLLQSLAIKACRATVFITATFISIGLITLVIQNKHKTTYNYTSLQQPKLPLTSLPWNISTAVPPKPTRIKGVDGEGVFRDVGGRQRLFRGVNVVYKGPPWYPDLDKWDRNMSFNLDDVAFIGDLNINAVRLGVMWPGVEPERGQYNHTYLDKLGLIVNRLNEKGVYVILDMHQDALSERFCGEGIPYWAVDTKSSLDRIGIHPPKSAVGFPQPAAPPYNVDEKGIPSRADCDKFAWATYHFTYDAANAYQNLWDNQDGLLDAFANYWKTVAAYFRNYTNILAYELMNEPFAGQVFENPSLLLPGVADRVNLQRAYAKIGDAIREVDKQTMILFAGVTWSNFLTGFTDTPGNLSVLLILNLILNIRTPRHAQPHRNKFPLL
jgi:hypothetical protein